MNIDDDNDTLPGDDELKALYRSLPRKEPSPALDAAVKRAAADAVRTPHRRVPRWPVTVASVAVVAVVASLGWRATREPASLPQVPTSSMASASSSAATTDQARTEKAPAAAMASSSPTIVADASPKEPAPPAATDKRAPHADTLRDAAKPRLLEPSVPPVARQAPSQGNDSTSMAHYAPPPPPPAPAPMGDAVFDTAIGGSRATPTVHPTRASSSMPIPAPPAPPPAVEEASANAIAPPPAAPSPPAPPAALPAQPFAADRSAAQTAGSLDTRADKLVEQAPMPAPAPAPPTMQEAPANIVSSSMAPAPAPIAPAPAPEQAMAPRAATSMAKASVAMQAAPMPMNDATLFNPADTPAQELEKIRQLFALQRHGEGVQRLQRFQRAHPDIELPADLRVQLPPHE